MKESDGRRRRPGPRAGLVATAAAVLLAAVAAPVGAQARSGVAENPDRYRAELQAAMDDLRDLGAVGAQVHVSVGRRDTVARGGVADRRSPAPMPLRGHFRIGSNTKTFVSVVMLQLVGEGRVSLEDSVERWLPGVVSGNGNDGSRITVRQLLQHMSGIYDYTNDLPAVASAAGYHEHRFDHFDLADQVDMAMRHAPRFAPGARWEYSNTNYILAGMIIEKVTGRPWSAEVSTRILRPLGMRDTSYPSDRPFLPRPSAHAYHQFAADGPLVDVSLVNPTAGAAAGGMVSTTADLARFWRALQRGELLRPAQLSEMRETVLAEGPQAGIPGVRSGLGIFWAPNRCGGFWAHPGDVPGTHTVNAVTETGDRLVVLYWTGGLAGPDAGAALQSRAFRLVDDIICG